MCIYCCWFCKRNLCRMQASSAWRCLGPERLFHRCLFLAFCAWCDLYVPAFLLLCVFFHLHKIQDLLIQYFLLFKAGKMNNVWMVFLQQFLAFDKFSSLWFVFPRCIPISPCWVVPLMWLSTQRTLLLTLWVFLPADEESFKVPFRTQIY